MLVKLFAQLFSLDQTVVDLLTWVWGLIWTSLKTLHRNFLTNWFISLQIDSGNFKYRSETFFHVLLRRLYSKHVPFAVESCCSTTKPTLDLAIVNNVQVAGVRPSKSPPWPGPTTAHPEGEANLQQGDDFHLYITLSIRTTCFNLSITKSIWWDFSCGRSMLQN